MFGQTVCSPIGFRNETVWKRFIKVHPVEIRSLLFLQISEKRLFFKVLKCITLNFIVHIICSDLNILEYEPWSWRRNFHLWFYGILSSYWWGFSFWLAYSGLQQSLEVLTRVLDELHWTTIYETNSMIFDALSSAALHSAWPWFSL